MFAEQKTALILDELQTWYDGLHDEPGPKERSGVVGPSILSKLFPSLLRIAPIYSALSFRFATTQPMRSSRSIVKALSSSTSKGRLRAKIARSSSYIDCFKTEATCLRQKSSRPFMFIRRERVRLLYADKMQADKARLRAGGRRMLAICSRTLGYWKTTF